MRHFHSNATLIVFVVAMFLFPAAASEPANEPDLVAVSQPIETHLAIGDGLDGHVHVFVYNPLIKRITISVVDSKGEALKDYIVEPKFRGDGTAELFLHLPNLPKETVERAVGVRVRGFKMTTGGSVDGFDSGTVEAIPMAGCIGFCLQFRSSCNTGCWAPFCCGVVDESTYWCGGETGNCDGNCDCICGPDPC